MQHGINICLMHFAMKLFLWKFLKVYTNGNPYGIAEDIVCSACHVDPR
jgi:hypothetical protein